MLIMETSEEEVLQILERYTKLKPKDIPKELEDYLCYVAKTGDTVYRWANVKYLFREKLMHVIKDFHDTTPSLEDIPQYPNVDPFNYDAMRSALLERLEMFNAAPFTIQRLCELLTDPRKQYSRIDKYMRALEKNILVVSTIEPGRKQPDSENGDSLDSVVNGDISLDVNVDIDMENESIFNIEPPSTSNTSSTSSASIAAASAAASSRIEEEDCKMASVSEIEKTDDAKDDEDGVKTENSADENTKEEEIQDVAETEKKDEEPEKRETKTEEEHKLDVDSKNDGQAQEMTEVDNVNQDEKPNSDGLLAPSETIQIPKEVEARHIQKQDEPDLSDGEKKVTTELQEAKETPVAEDLPSEFDATEEQKSKTQQAVEEPKQENIENPIETAPSNAVSTSNNPEIDPVLEESAKIESGTPTLGSDTEAVKTIMHSQEEVLPSKDELVSTTITITTEEKSFSKAEVATAECTPLEVINVPQQSSDVTTKIPEEMSIEETTAAAALILPALPSDIPASLISPVTLAAETQLTPSLASDQPMEDTILTSACAPVESSSCVDEVVMQSETGMAIDADPMKLAEEKPDLGSMEVDDTSQEEAMDQ